jgi:YD repeat-containing protein
MLAPISSSGPLTRVETSPDLNCSVNYAGDGAGEFYGDTACGTFLSVGGVLYGPANVPAGAGAGRRTAWTPVSQAGPSGSGTVNDPYVTTTVVDAGTAGIRVTQTDTYLPGQGFYRTDVRIDNQSGVAQSARVWRAADCYLGNSDYGYGAVNSRAGTVGFRQGCRLEQWQPLTAGSHYYEDSYYAVWARIGAQQAFADTCACTSYIDNGAGLSWDLSVGAGGSATVAHRTNFTTTLPELDLQATFGPDCNCDSLGEGVNHQWRTERPVNTATGAESDSFADAAYPGPGIPFALTRFYTSADPADGPFGVGWTFAYNASLSEDTSTGAVDVRAESGAHAVFARNADGSYATPPAATSQLARTSFGWTLTAPDGHYLAFDTAGGLTAIKDRSGVGVTVETVNGQLARVTDAAGRVVTFTWTGNRITQVRLADGRHIDYGYTDGHLTSVSNLRGKITTLAWDANGKLTSVQDPNGHYRFRNTYDGSTGRVTEQLDPLGNRTTFTWDAVRQIATRTDARGKVWTEYYAGNVLIERDDPSGNAWLFDYDQHLNLTSVTDPRGNTTTYRYDALGDVIDEIGPAPSSHTRHWEWDTTQRLLTSYRDRDGGVPWNAGYIVDNCDAGTSTTVDARPAGTHLGGTGKSLIYRVAGALDEGQIGILKPGKVTANGPDYLTFDPNTGQVVVWDAKYSSSGRFPSGSIPSSKLADWNAAVQDAVNSYTGPSADALKQALANGAIRGEYFPYP